MPSRKEGLVVLYPEYFDSRLTRKQGRRVPKSLAHVNPTLESLLSAVREADAGFEPRAEPKSAYSPRWWEKRGRVLVKRKYSKQKTLLMVAKKLQ